MSPRLALPILALLGTTTASPLSTRAATPTTLLPGYSWIRAVEDPNFHKYLQTTPVNTPAIAVLNAPATAGQYQLVAGQLVEYTGASAAPLYMNVQKPADLTQRTLITSFNATKNTFGTFAFQGDALTWTTPEIKRQNTAAWYVCENQHLYINTGAYLYQTPAGCADETIHSYGGSTATA